MGLFKYEFNKLFTKLNLFLFFILMIFWLSLTYSNFKEFEYKTGDLNLYSSLANDNQGEIDENKVKNIETYYANEDGGTDYSQYNLSTEEKVEYYFQLSYNAAHRRSVQWERIKSMKNSNDTLDELRLLTQVGNPGFYNTGGFEELSFSIASTASAIFITLLVIIIFTPVFTQDYKNNMFYTIRTSYYGFNKLVRVKLLSSLLFTFILVTVYYWFNILFYNILYWNNAGMSAPLNSISRFLETPFNINIFTFLVMNYVTLLLSTCVMVIIIFTLSNLIRKEFIVMGISTLIFTIPFFTIRGGLVGRIATIISPAVSMDGSSLYGQYVAINIFGKSIQTVYLHMIFSIITVVLGIFIIFHLHRRKKT